MALIKCKECGTDVSTTAKACPKCGAAVKYTRPITKVFGAIMALVVGAAIVAGFNDGSGSGGAQQASAAQPEFTTTATDIAQAYAGNTVAADNYYKGRVFKISGTVRDINTDITGNAVLVLSGGVNDFLDPQAQLIDDDKSKAGSLQKGSKVMLQCTGEGDIAKTPMMKNCSIL